MKNDHGNVIKNNEILIGEIRLNLNLLVDNKDTNNICFDGYLKVLHQGNKNIGRLKIKIIYNNQQFSPDTKLKTSNLNVNNLGLSKLDFTNLMVEYNY